MTTAAIATLFGAFFIALVAVPMVRPNATKRALARARHTGDVSALVALIEARRGVDAANGWDSTIGMLWQRYEREIAVKLIVAGAERSEAKILQYWITQAMQIEPELCQTYFTPEFLADHFRPEVASQCGRCGCKG